MCIIITNNIKKILEFAYKTLCLIAKLFFCLSMFNSLKFVSIVAVVYMIWVLIVQSYFTKKHLHSIISGLFLIFLAIAKSLQVKIYCHAACNGIC